MSRRKKGEKINGWVNLDKPYGMGSTQALAKVRHLLNAQKAGHAGTLDPLASGVLPIALGEATKTISFAQDHIKTYKFTITWGERRNTEDSEGTVIQTSDIRPTRDQIESALPRFIGEISQIPPDFSALKIDGERAYDLARAGEAITLAPRMVYIESLTLNDTTQGTADFTMVCGKGTYVRAIARDLGATLGTCGYISALRRTRVGNFTDDTAISLDRLVEIVQSAASITDVLDEVLQPLETVLDDIPALAMKAEEIARLRNGQVLSFISRPDFARLQNLGLENQSGLALATFESRAVALVDIEGPSVKSVRVFNL